MSEPTCAVWYYRHGCVYYMLCNDEAAAVRYADGMADTGDGAVDGIQFADGRYWKREDWSALKIYQQAQWDAVMLEIRNSPPSPRPTREVRLPWDPSKTVIVESNAPAWLGATVSR